MPLITEDRIKFYSSDINLGYEGLNYLSENHDEYRAHELERKMTKEERMDTLRDLRGTHYKLGNEYDNNQYISEGSKVYLSIIIQWGNTVKGVQPEHLNEEKLNDLRRTHFSLGNDNNNYESLNTLSYKKPKERGRGDLEEGLLHDLRREHFTLGSDANNYLSTSHASHIKYKPDEVDEVAKQELLRDLRACHFNLGSEGKHYETTNYMPSYDGFKPPDHLDLKLRNSHWGLGDESLNYKTETMEMSKKIPKKGDLLDSVNEQDRLTNKHEIGMTRTIYKEPPPTAKVSITVGTDHVNYLTESNDSYRPIPADYKVARNPKLWNTHWKIGDSKLDYKTTNYQKNLYKEGFEPSELNTEKKNDLRRVHYSLGDEGGNFETTYNAAYFEKEVPFKPPRDPNLQKTHFELGTEYHKPMSISQSTYSDRGTHLMTKEEIKQQREILRDLRATHYKLGNENNSYETTGKMPDPYKYGYHYKKADPSMQLWNTHFTLGQDGSRRYDTTAKLQQEFVKDIIQEP